MRRVWLLALAVVPAVAAGQVAPNPGEVTFDNEFINSTECAGSGNISLSWEVQLVTSVAATFPTNGRMRVIATNQDFSGNECPIEGTPSGRHAAQVGTEIVNPSLPEVTNQSYLAKAFVDAAQVGCATEADIWVCVQFLDGNGTKAGFAKGVTTLKTRFGKPLAPTGVSAPGGDHALVVSFSDPNSPKAAEFRIVAESVLDPTLATTGADPRDTGSHSMTAVTTSENRLRDLVNDVVYKVVVFAQDEADNESDPSNAVTGMPQAVNDLGDQYHADGGREQGGCAGGPAGLASLALAAATLAVLRRRR
jgi:hypothetical protein